MFPVFHFSLAPPNLQPHGSFPLNLHCSGRYRRASSVRQDGTTGSQNVCKIYEAHLVFALAGLASDVGVDVVEEIKNSMLLHEQDTGRTVPLDSLWGAAGSALTKVLLAHHIASNPTIPIELLIAGTVDGKLQMVRIDETGWTIQGNIAFANSTRHIGYPESRGYKGTDPNRGFEILGINDTAGRFQKLLPGWTMGDDAATIVIDKKGVKWVDKGVCEWTPTKPSK